MNRKARNDRFRRHTIVEWTPTMSLSTRYKLDEKQSHSPVDKARKRAREKKAARSLLNLYWDNDVYAKYERKIDWLLLNRPLHPVITATQTFRHPHDSKVKYGNLTEVKNE